MEFLYNLFSLAERKFLRLFVLMEGEFFVTKKIIINFITEIMFIAGELNDNTVDRCMVKRLCNTLMATLLSALSPRTFIMLRYEKAFWIYFPKSCTALLKDEDSTIYRTIYLRHLQRSASMFMSCTHFLRKSFCDSTIFDTTGVY